MLQLSGRLSGYIPTIKELTIAPHSTDTIRDTLRLSYAGIPVVSGLRLLQNIFTGAVQVSWNKATFDELKDYVVYQDPCDAIDLLPEPTHSCLDTVLIDSTFTSLYATLSDTFPRCLKYRVAVRTIAQTTGLTNGYATMQFMPKVFVWTFISHDVRYKGRLTDSVSIDDTVVYTIAAQNRTRPLRKLVYLEPIKGHFPIVLKDTTKKELRESRGFAFHDTGNHKIYAIVTDSAGNEWWDEVTVRTIIDSLTAQAGNDTGVFIGEKVHLHGGAVDLFGSIPFWRWKIGDNEWRRTSAPDTVFPAPLTEQTTECDLWITDEDGANRFDTMRFVTSLKAISIAAGGSHSLILKTDGGLWACGNNLGGQLCNGRIGTESIPIRIADNVVSMAAGESYTLILKKGGDLWACGNNANGQFGDGTTEGRLIPKRIMTDVQSIIAGKNFSLVLKTDSTLWVYGWDQRIQPAIGATANRYLPIMVMTNVQTMAAGDFHILILKTDRTLWSCGENDYGQLGNGNHQRSALPVQVMDSVRTMAAGDKFSLVVKTNGTLWGFGLNNKGQLGERTADSHTKPIMVASYVQSVVAGSEHSLILKTDKTVWSTGANEKGQCGKEGTSSLFSFTQIMSDGQSIAAGSRHSLIVKTDGSVWACGEDLYGQLGNGTKVNRPTPVRMIPYHYYPK
jgi:alpha-tubulin suppressor-like RCC1 family protein